MSADLPGTPERHNPSLDHLFRALTADGSADELADKDAALAMFRDNRRRARRRLGFVSPISMAAAAAVIVGGIAGATYAAALPSPVQHMAHLMLDRIGVPDVYRPSPSPSTQPAVAPVPSAAPAVAGCPCQAGQTGASPARNLVLAAARARIPAYGDDILSGRLAHDGRPEPGVRLQLFEHVDGHPGWRLAGSAITDHSGDVTVAVQHLTSNASFRLLGPEGAASSAVPITVIPPIYLQLAAGQLPRTDILTARVPFADTGDIVLLQELSGTVWYSIAERVLDRHHLASFTVLVSRSGDHDYRVVIPQTIAHGSSVSDQVRVVGSYPRPTSERQVSEPVRSGRVRNSSSTAGRAVP